MILDLFCITFIIVFIVDISGVVYHIKKYILKLLFKLKNPDPESMHIHLLECSLCITWWSGIIYILLTNNFNIYSLALVAVFSLLTSVIGNTIQLILDLCNTIISKIYSLIK